MGTDDYGNKYYKSKNERWVVYSNNMKLQKSLRIGIYGCIIQLIKFQIKRSKHILAKKHLENQTGTKIDLNQSKLEKIV